MSTKNHWLISDKGDPIARALADRHYTRQTPGAKGFCRNGQNLVFVSVDSQAAWVTFRPTPGVAVRLDGLDVWECTLFRNEGSVLSSLLIREAVQLTWALWGIPPSGGIITYVKPEAIKTEIPGYCFRRAGWRRIGAARDGKPMLRAPSIEVVPPLTSWHWRGHRGGLLRRQLEQANKYPTQQLCLELAL